MREDYFYTDGLTVGYQGVPLIREIAFQLKKGEILTLIDRRTKGLQYGFTMGGLCY